MPPLQGFLRLCTKDSGTGSCPAREQRMCMVCVPQRESPGELLGFLFMRTGRKGGSFRVTGLTGAGGRGEPSRRLLNLETQGKFHRSQRGRCERVSQEFHVEGFSERQRPRCNLFDLHPLLTDNSTQHAHQPVRPCSWSSGAWAWRHQDRFIGVMSSLLQKRRVPGRLEPCRWSRLRPICQRPSIRGTTAADRPCAKSKGRSTGFCDK